MPRSPGGRLDGRVGHYWPDRSWTRAARFGPCRRPRGRYTEGFVVGSQLRDRQMKKKIHPKYTECQVKCGCGNTFVTESTVSSMNIEICSKCHPFYTGQQKFVDTAGRVERFQKKFGGEYFKPAAKKKTVGRR